MDTTTIAQSEPRKLTFDESRQLLVIQQTPESERTDEQRAIWQVYTTRNAWEDARRAERKKVDADLADKARLAQYEYRQRLLAEERREADHDSMDYFMRRLNQRSVQPQALRLTDSAEKAYEYLTAAYLHEVAAVGRTAQMDDMTRTVLHTAARWLTNHTKPGLIMRGNVGVGKTTLMLALRDVLSIRLGVHCQVWDAARIAALGKGKDGQQVLDGLCTNQLLGIDDLGTEPLTVKDYGNDITPLVSLLTERYNKRLTTIITTNLAIVEREGKQVDEIAERYGERIADRLRELCHTITYDSKQQSYRN